MTFPNFLFIFSYTNRVFISTENIIFLSSHFVIRNSFGKMEKLLNSSLLLQGFYSFIDVLGDQKKMSVYVTKDSNILVKNTVRA